MIRVAMDDKLRMASGIRTRMPAERVAASGKEINDWLFRNGYHKVPFSGLRYYLRPGACFLAIRVKGLKDRAHHLRPLHVAYRSAEIRLPLKFFANAGEFDVYLYAVEKEAVKPDRSGLQRWGLQPSGRFLPDSAFVEQSGMKDLARTGIRIVRYTGTGINSPKNRIAKWKEDPLLLVD